MEEILVEALEEAIERTRAQIDPGRVADLLAREPDVLAQCIAGHLTHAAVWHTTLRSSIEALSHRPYVILRRAFAVTELPDTPIDFSPVPMCETTLRARLMGLGLHAAFGRETIAYRSENNGALFVNLVSMAGEGRIAEKSSAPMRGHTDAVSFPFSDMPDPVNARISPSPDIVTLVGLRNPDAVPTTVMPLDRILSALSAEDIAELQKPQFAIQCQNTFRAGTKKILGAHHSVSGGQILLPVAGEWQIRFSHSKVRPDDDNAPANAAVTHLAEACVRAAVPVTVEPGGLLLIRNRLALHGRAQGLEGLGGNSRWLLRAYGLERAVAGNATRDGDEAYQLFP